MSSLALWALLVACQPTRGLDVGAIEFVHKRLVEERDRGTAVVIARQSWTKSSPWPTGSR